MGASMINGHDDKYYDTPVFIRGTEIRCRMDAVAVHVCENCGNVKHGSHPGIIICGQSCYDACVSSHSVPTDQYFWCKGKNYKE
jgi:hypothetical protein